MPKSTPITIECIKPITLHGDDDGLSDTMECNAGDIFGNSHSVVSTSDYGYEISYGAAYYWIYTEDFETHFRVISKDKSA